MSVKVYSLLPSFLILNLLSKEAFARLGKREDDTLLGSVKALAALEQLLHSSLPLLFLVFIFGSTTSFCFSVIKKKNGLALEPASSIKVVKSTTEVVCQWAKQNSLSLCILQNSSSYLSCSVFILERSTRFRIRPTSW